jgi:hypothetical protein
MVARNAELVSPMTSGRDGVYPLHGSREFSVVADIAHERSLEVRDRSEYASEDDVGLDLASVMDAIPV